MRFLDARKKTQQENKMMPGSRPDQRDPAVNTVRNIDLGPDKPKIRPEVQALADDLGVDITKVKGTGANGSILMKDVRDAKAKELDDELEPESTEVDPLDPD